MFKRFFIIIALTTIVLTLGLNLAEAYQIDASFRPHNSPFSLDFSNSENASLNTIIILQLIAGALLYFAAPIAVILIAIGGWQIVTGGAETEKIEQGKKHLTWSVAGLLLIILSYSAVRYIILFVVQAAENVQ